MRKRLDRMRPEERRAQREERACCWICGALYWYDLGHECRVFDGAWEEPPDPEFMRRLRRGARETEEV